jgi:hypothetical protein
MSTLIRLGAAAAFAVLPAAAMAQETPADGAPLRVFIDCQWACDMDYMRTEINWVNYMRDRADAQVHVMVTPQGTGGGGRRYTIELIGLRDFAGMADTLYFSHTADTPGEVTRRGLTNVMKVGLMRYVANSPLAHQFSITLGQPQRTPGEPVGAVPGGATPAVAQRDPWNSWTFRVGFNGNLDGEQSRDSYRVSNSLSANRTTEAWKVNFSVNGSYNEQSFTYPVATDRDTTIVSIRRNYGANGLVVKSVSGHMSAGVRGNVSTSTFGNTKLQVSLMPALEYNIFPYAESTRRQFTMQYAAGMRRFEYRDTTIYFQTEEARPAHSLSLSYGTRQPWGSANFSVDGSQYLHDTSKYNGTLYGGVSEIRLFRGLSFNLFGNYSLIRDQITLPKGRLTQDQVLLRQRELQTGYRYFVSGGISYRFGSIFNNVVNPRFGGGGGGGGMMMFIEG